MRGIGAGERIFELLDRNPAVPPNTGLPVDPARRGPIRFEEVYFRYPSRPGVQILKHLDLEVNVGESVALVWVALSQLHTRSTDCCLNLAARVEVENPRSMHCCLGITTRRRARSLSMGRVWVCLGFYEYATDAHAH